MQPVAASFKAVSYLSWWKQNRSLSALDNFFLKNSGGLGSGGEDPLNGISIHYVQKAFLFDAYCALVKNLLG